MRVLFVDDETMILDGIQRRLFHRADDWDIECVTSGEEAIEVLEEDDFDVLVTDMRMPGMDGAALLRHVAVKHPQIIRIVLSGYADTETTLRAVPVTHQFLAKPCQPDCLERVVDRALRLQGLLDNEELRAVLGEVRGLPSLPQVYTELTEALADDSCSVPMLDRIVRQDPGICAKLLQLVNSSFFSRGASISDVRQALLRLGFDTVKNLALAVEVFRAGRLKRRVRDFLSLDVLQRDAMSAATLARAMLKDKREADDAFMAAMLRDCGLLVLATELPDRTIEAYELAAAEGIDHHEAERRVFGASHAEVGAYLLGTWGLPYPIVDAVANHHAPQRVPSDTFGVVEAVHVASQLVHDREIDPAYLAARGVRDRLVEWETLAGATREAAA